MYGRESLFTKMPDGTFRVNSDSNEFDQWRHPHRTHDLSRRKVFREQRYRQRTGNKRGKDREGMAAEDALEEGKKQIVGDY